jgi:hypothetical protein
VTHLLDTRVVYFIPTVNVDGNVIALADSQDARKTANPSSSDDDNDGRFDEDPSIGFGYGTHTLRLYRFDPAWADAHPNDPFVGGWQSSLQGNPQVLGRFTGALGGPMEQIPEIDADRDGRVHEDEIGGVDPNRNYDAHWARTTDTSDETYGGPRVWSEPESKAVRDFVAELPTLATGLSYHSGVDVILHPWGWSANADLPDAGIYELLSRKGTQLTEANGFPGSPHTWTAQGLYPARGSTMDYLYESRGVMAWSPEVYGSSNTSYIARVGATNAYTVGTSTGFAFNPRPETILASTDRWNRFALYLLAATPNLEVNAVYVDAGDLVVVIGNDGLLPVAVQPVFTGPGDTSRPLEPRLLQATNTVWRIPLMGLGDGPFTLSADAELQVGTMPHKVETLRASFHLEDGAVVLDDGEVRPFIDLAATIPEGWFAGDEWDVGPYHRGQPIPATPPSIPTPFEPPASTPMPTDTPPATAPPTATPTATESPTPRPAPVYLPQALQNSRPAAR